MALPGRMLSFCMNWGGQAKRVVAGLRIANRRPGTGFVPFFIPNDVSGLS